MVLAVLEQIIWTITQEHNLLEFNQHTYIMCFLPSIHIYV